MSETEADTRTIGQTGQRQRQINCLRPFLPLIMSLTPLAGRDSCGNPSFSRLDG